MKGYFSSLAKQSSVSIRGGKTSAARLANTPITETLAPLHSETVLFVDSTPTAVSPVRDSQTTEKTLPRAISQHSSTPIENSQTRFASRSLAPPAISNSSRQPRTDDALSPVAPVENSFSTHKSPTVATENSEDPVVPLVDRPNVELGGPSKKGGVIRVGESESPIEMTRASSSEMFRRDVPTATSIRHEYLEGIREWLDSPPLEIEGSERRRALQQTAENTFGTVKDRGQSPRPTIVDPEVSAQNEIQEFNLSIGSISIVVEEPPAPKQQVNHVQPQTPAAVSPAAPAHDAFALSRRYFRGF